MVSYSQPTLLHDINNLQPTLFHDGISKQKIKTTYLNVFNTYKSKAKIKASQTRTKPH
jgi:hypothetical protein